MTRYAKWTARISSTTRAAVAGHHSPRSPASPRVARFPSSIAPEMLAP